MIIQSIDRALDILSFFSYAKPRWGITELALAMNLPKGTIHNIVSTLDSAGFLKQDEETRKYCLGPKLFSLGTTMGGTLEINQKASGPVLSLVQKTGLMSRVAIWHHDACTLDHGSGPAQLPRPGPETRPSSGSLQFGSYNQKLSERRAQAVVDYLAAKRGTGSRQADWHGPDQADCRQCD